MPTDHGAYDITREDLPAVRGRAQPRRFDHRIAEVIAVLLDRFATRHTDPHRQRDAAPSVVAFDPLLHRDPRTPAHDSAS